MMFQSTAEIQLSAVTFFITSSPPFCDLGTFNPVGCPGGLRPVGMGVCLAG